MTTPVEQLSFKPNAATGAVARELQTWAGEIVNVKDFGAVGDGATDDTSSIQAALNAAFGTVLAPHGLTGNQPAPGAGANKRVYFPAGTYLVSSSIPTRNISNAVLNGDGSITYTTSVAHGFADKQLVYIDGVQVTDTFVSANGTRFIKPGDSVGANLTTMFTTYATGLACSSPTMPSGTVRTAALQVCAVYGGVLCGSGSKSAIIKDIDSGGLLLHANGWNGCSVRDLGFSGGATKPTDSSHGFVFDVDVSGSAVVISGGIQGIFADSFYNCNFGSWDTGVAISPTMGSQGDTVDFHNCVWISNNIGASVGLQNFNAININFFGGEAISNNYGLVSFGGGCMGTVSGTLFTDNATWDIFHFGSGITCPVFSGITTESKNFCYTDFCQPVLIGCNQRDQVSGTGYFLHCKSMQGTIDTCWSEQGKVAFEVGGLIRNSQFGRSDAIDSDANFPKPVYVKYSVIGGAQSSTKSGFLIGLTDGYPYHDGFFINTGGGAQYFVGYKTELSFTGSAPSSDITRMFARELPVATNTYCIGRNVTVWDSSITQVSSNKNITIAGSSSTSNVVTVMSNGTNWVLV